MSHRFWWSWMSAKSRLSDDPDACVSPSSRACSRWRHRRVWCHSLWATCSPVTRSGHVVPHVAHGREKSPSFLSPGDRDDDDDLLLHSLLQCESLSPSDWSLVPLLHRLLRLSLRGTGKRAAGTRCVCEGRVVLVHKTFSLSLPFPPCAHYRKLRMD